MLQLLRKLDLMRIVLGICIVVDGMPLVFFFKETLGLAPGSQVFTALFLGFGFVLCVPFTIFRRLYRPNALLFWMAVWFIALSIFSMYYFNGVPGFKDYNVDFFYFLFSLVFLFLLINIPNDIIEVAVPVIIGFTVVSNMALVYAMLTDPTWTIGQRAVINFGSTETGERLGNAHVFARNALMGVIACGIWAFRPETGIIPRILSLFSAAFSAGILILTQTRSSIVALLIVVALFLFFNVRPAQIKTAVRGLLKPIPIITIAVFIFGMLFLLRRYYDVYSVLYGYVLAFVERNLENVYAALGMKSSGMAYKAALDASVANRTISTGFLSNILIGHMEMLVFGNGYKFQYLDIPVLEAFINHGILGLILFGGLNAMCLYHSLRAMQTNPNTLTTFLAYFYILVLVQMFTNGRPYEIYHWHPLGLMIRFMGIDKLIPVRLWNNPPAVSYDGYAVPTVQPTAMPVTA